MIGGAVPSKKPKTTLPSGMGGLFFHYVIRSALSDLPIYHRYSKEGKCGAALSDFIETMTLTSRQYTNIYCIYEVYSVYI